VSANFLDHIKEIEDGRIPGMTTYPLDEVLLTVLVGLLCRMEDFDEITMFGEEQLDWLRRILPFANGVAPAQTRRRALRALDPKALGEAAGSALSLRAASRNNVPMRKFESVMPEEVERLSGGAMSGAMRFRSADRAARTNRAGPISSCGRRRSESTRNFIPKSSSTIWWRTQPTSQLNLIQLPPRLHWARPEQSGQAIPAVLERRVRRWSCNTFRFSECCHRQKDPKALDTSRYHNEATDSGNQNI